MKYKITITTEVETVHKEDAESWAFDNLASGDYKIESEEIEE